MIEFVSPNSYVDVIAEAVLWVWIVFFNLFGKNWSSVLLNNWSWLVDSLLDKGSRLLLVNSWSGRQ